MSHAWTLTNLIKTNTTTKSVEIASEASSTNKGCYDQWNKEYWLHATNIHEVFYAVKIVISENKIVSTFSTFVQLFYSKEIIQILRTSKMANKL